MKKKRSRTGTLSLFGGDVETIGGEANADNLSYDKLRKCGFHPNTSAVSRREYLDPESGELLYPDTVQVTLYVDAGEGSVTLGKWPAGRERLVSSHPDRVRSRREAERRARARVRRYCAANDLTRLVTLTYAGEGCHDRAEALADVVSFIRRLREALGGDAFPYVYVPELHPGGHGWHLHMGLGQYVAQPLLQKLWGHGWVSVKKIHPGPGEGRKAAARQAAAYLAKEVSKSYGEVYAQADADWVRRLGEGLALLAFLNPGIDTSKSLDVPQRMSRPHAYEVGQDHQPRVVKQRVCYMAEGRKVLWDYLAGSDFPVAIWRSKDTEEWFGPPCEVWFF